MDHVVWFPEERKAWQHALHILRDAPQGTEQYLEELVETVRRAESMRKFFDRQRGRCNEVLAQMAESVRSFCRELPESNGIFVSNAKGARHYPFFCQMLRELERGTQCLQWELLATATGDTYEREQRFLRAKYFCRVAHNEFPELAERAKEWLRILSAEREQMEQLRKEEADWRAATERLCREELPLFCERAAELADMAHDGENLQCASLRTLCEKWALVLHN